ncbi:unnamed protein product [Moneuplotes crassus]|uniref:3-beta hydroxysteroid dehydrogenase/isomerase domain-containing protein n=1 Tax=Euplotes crassus TaxID=5936 RepID=A0AAD1XI32_EUPCR|nr:unnamed protein product [Moneuplotes crassus]
MESSSEKPLVLVTGASGYIGSWCIAKLLDTDKYRVRGTVRDHTDKSRMEILQKGFGDYFDQIEFVSANLQDEDSMKSAIEGAKYVLHVASPFPLNSPKDGEKEVIQPAIDGNRHMLNACVGSDVKKLIITSSCVAVQDFWENPDKVSNHKTFVKERKDHTPYYKSKIRAERYTYDFLDNLKPSERTFEVMMINPSFVTGKALLPRAEGTSLSLIKNVLENKLPGVPQKYFANVDVQDVAQAHVNAIEKGKDGGRYPLANGNYKFLELMLVISEEYSDQGYKILNKEISKILAWIVSFFNKDVAFFLTCWNIKAEVDGSFAAEELGIEYKSMKESVLEACKSLIEFDLVAKP